MNVTKNYVKELGENLTKCQISYATIKSVKYVVRIIT